MILHGDCRDILPTLEQVDAVVTDPPYGLSFMGKDLDGAILRHCPLAAEMTPARELCLCGHLRSEHHRGRGACNHNKRNPKGAFKRWAHFCPRYRAGIANLEQRGNG